MTHAGDGSGNVYVTERAGIIKRVTGSVSSVFLDISSAVYSEDGETGMLGLAFHPDYKNNRYFYLNYTIKPGNTIKTRISRFTANPSGTGNVASEMLLLEYDQPFSNHNGGSLLFGKDGYLYIASGDGGSSGDLNNYAQNKQSLLGKILRIDVNSVNPYSIPSDNPITSATEGRREIYAYGFRNPWKMSMDRTTGQIYVGDVGQSAREEIDLLAKGGNYGWRIMEGTVCYNPNPCNNTTGLVGPIYDYARVSVNCSVTAGYVYRGAVESLKGLFIFGDFCSGNIWTLTVNSASITRSVLFETTYTISSFGEDEAGEVYVLDYSGGKVYKITGPVSGLTSNHSIEELTLSPNPATSSLTIKNLGINEEMLIHIYDMQGKFIAPLNKISSNKDEAIFSTSHLHPGVYMLSIIDENKVQYNQRLVINER